VLARIFDGLNSGLKKELGKGEYDRRRGDFVFHMTDWLTDLGALNELYEHPDRFTTSAASQQLYGILVHVIPHLREAGRLLDGKEIPDPFATGADPVPAKRLAGVATRGPKERT
jgi:hypothetical protein